MNEWAQARKREDTSEAPATAQSSTPSGVFISYRRSDTDVAAGRLADDLIQIFGSETIFRDVDTLEPGEDYTVALEHALDRCAVLIAVMGTHWASSTDDAGHRRLDDPGDWVRAEIRRALERGIRVIPVLVSATMPRDSEVPADLKPLLLRQALEISDRHWKQDLDLLAQVLEKIPGIHRKATPSPTQDQTPGSKTEFLASHWVQLVLGFSVSAIVGLAPYLGKFVPMFTPILSILPEAIQSVAIPLSAAGMGIVTVLVQWQIIHKLPPDQTRLWFRRTVLTCGISLTALTAVEMIAVVRVDVPAVNQTVSFAIGPVHPRTPPCAHLSRAECIKQNLSLDEAQIDSYFGEGWADLTKFTLVLLYTVFTSSFGALMVMLMREMRIRSSNAKT